MNTSIITRPALSFAALFSRVLVQLKPEARLAFMLAGANLGLALFQFLEPILFGRLIESLTRGKPVVLTLALWAIAGLAAIVAGVAVAQHADRLAHRRRLAAMAAFFEHVLALPPSLVSAQHTGRLNSIMLRGADQMFGIWLSLFRESLAAFMAVLVLLPAAFFMNMWMSALLLALVSVFAVLNALVVRRALRGQAAVEHHHAAVATLAGDVMGQVMVVQAFTRLSAEVKGLRDAMTRLLDAQYPVLRGWAVVSVLTRAFSTLTMVSLFALGSFLHARQQITVGGIVTFIGFAGVLMGRVEQLTGFFNTLFSNSQAVREFFTLMDVESSIKDAPDALPLQVSHGRVEFQKVSFTYPGTATGVHHLDVTLEPGEMLALVGKSGSGKSTLASLLLRVRDPDSGAVLIDGQDIRGVTLASLRHNIGVVFQETGLFARSIIDNVHIGRPEATQDEIMAAVKQAQAYDFIVARPQGFHTQLGERGHTLSGGERQRITLARALLKNAPLLILDEATSALDVETEAQLSAALEAARKNRTTLIIAHRLSTVRRADRIAVMENGRIVEIGPYTELAAANGPFAALLKVGEMGDAS